MAHAPFPSSTAFDSKPDSSFVTAAAPREYSRPTRALINLDALRHNAAQLAQHLCGDAKLLAVIKANAYGHGAVTVARALLETTREYSPHCVSMLGVASADEGAELRDAGIRAPILLLSAILPEEARAAIRFDLTPTIFSEELARACDDAARDAGKIADYHFKIDTGMNRLGAGFREAPRLLQTLREYSHVRLGGVYTHFACADEEDETMTRAQCERFQNALRECDFDQRKKPLIHAANSAAALRYSKMHFDLARTGLALYGLDPRANVAECDREYSLRPAMTLLSRVTHIKEVRAGATVSYGAIWRAEKPTRVAVVPVGYADGYPRLASGKAQVIIGGARCEVVGRITMDQMMVDCSRAPKTQIGAEVILFGDGASTRGGENEETISVNEVATWAQTIPYEVLCGIAPRVPRFAVTDDAPREYSLRQKNERENIMARDGGSEHETARGGANEIGRGGAIVNEHDGANEIGREVVTERHGTSESEFETERSVANEIGSGAIEHDGEHKRESERDDARETTTERDGERNGGGA